MSEAHSLCLLLALLYLTECLWWLPPSGAAVEQWWPSTRWRFRRPAAWASGRRGHFLALAPLPLGMGVQLPPPRLSLSPAGCCARSTVDWTGGPSSPGEPWAVRWEDIESIEVRDREVEIDGRRLPGFHRADSARQFADTLEALRRAKRRERETLLQKAWERQSDLGMIASQAEELAERVLPLRWIGAALYAWMFLVAPLTLAFVGGWQVLVALGVGCVILAVVAATTFVRVHRARFHDERWTRRESAAVMCVSWPRAARGADLLTRHGLEAFHPFAILVALSAGPAIATSHGNPTPPGDPIHQSDPSHQGDPARQGHRGATLDAHRSPLAHALRAAAHPLGLVDLDPLPREIVAWQAAFDYRVFGQLLTDAGLEIDASAPPAGVDPMARAYCPRCLADYTAVDGECAHCLGVTLKPLPLPSERIKSP